MRRLLLVAAVAVPLSACSLLSTSNLISDGRIELWTEAHQAFLALDFARAETAFQGLATGYADSSEGRESLFYLGALRLDPRNPEWSSEIAQQWLQQYLALAADEGPQLYRYPEAQTLQEIARQLNLPAESRIEPLQPGERVETRVERVVVPAAQSRALLAEVEQLRAQLAEQEQELERIRRTLTSPAR